MAKGKAKPKETANFPNIPGFECFPRGRLLSQKVEFDGPVGIAYERCIGYTKPAHSHDRMTLTFPRGASRSFIKVFPEARTDKLSETVVHLMAKDHRHEQGSISTIYDTFALFVTEEHCGAHLEISGAPAREIEAFLKTTRTLTRSPILDDLIRRYFFARVLDAAPPAMELWHLESMILGELFSLCRRTQAGSARSKPGTAEARAPDETALIRAIEFIETHLFESLDVPALVHSARTSQATLFRLFKREIGASPIEYVRNRRLDEARSLLRTGQYQVGDVALLVGYEDLSSFSKAFKLRFQTAPSGSLPGADKRPRDPAPRPKRR